MTGLLPGDQYVDSPTLPYLGVGYTGLSPRGGWSFNADLGLMSLTPSCRQAGRFFGGGQGLDDTSATALVPVMHSRSYSF